MVRLTTRMRRILAAGAAAAVVAGITVSATGPHAVAAVDTGTAATARAGDSPPGFWWGTDSWPISISGNPYQEPKGLGRYGGYIGMTGSWSYWLGCKGGFLAWSSANSAQANSNYAHGVGIGTGAYWFMGGPGVDPHYNGTASEAYAWGQRQAARAVADAKGEAIKYKVLFMDVELPGVAPAHDNGWNSVYTSSCSGKVKSSYIPANRRPGRLQRVLRLRGGPRLYGWRVLRRRRAGPRSSALAATPPSRAPTSGPTSRKPRTSAPPRPASASRARPAVPRSSAG